MTDLQTRLREGLRAEAERAQPHLLRELPIAPPRRSRSGRAGALGRGGQYRLLPWLAPVAAALAVVAVISGVRLTVGGRPHVPAGTAPTAGPAAPLPPYYVEAALHGQAKAWINDSATGRVISKVGIPGQLPVAISAAGDDRTFVIIFQGLYNGITTFTRLTLSADGHPASFTRLPVKLPANAGLELTGPTALSPDGQALALALRVEPASAAIIANPGAGRDATDEIELVSLRTGAARTWIAAPRHFVTDLSWARGNQTLAFLATPQGGLGNDGAGQVRILQVSRPAGGLLAASRPVPFAAAGGRVQSMQVTANGSRMVAWTRLPARPKSKGIGTLILAEFSTRTGRELRVFGRLPTVNGIPGYGVVYSADPSGQHVLILSERILSTYTSYFPSSPQVYTMPPYSIPPRPSASGAPGTFTPAPGASGTPRTFTQEPHAVEEARTDSFLGRLDNGQVTRLPTSPDSDDFGAW